MQSFNDVSLLSRRRWFAVSPLLGGMAALPFSPAAQSRELNQLHPPATGSIPVAFAISDGAVVIDYSGPWEVFQDVVTPGRAGDSSVFTLYTVAERRTPVTASGGLQLLPNYTFEDAPNPKVIVIPAQSGNTAMIRWIQKSFPATDVTMSVCTGAFILAKTGLLDGKSATTHHGAYARFAMQYGSKIQLKRGARFVEDGQVASAGGLTSGIDLALRVVERYYGREVAANTAFYMEYQGEGWKDPTGSSDSVYLKSSTGSGCAVCGMPVDASVKPSIFHGKAFHFCSNECKSEFDAAPASFAT